MEPIKTVRVKTDAPDNEDGFYVMNESDFDAGVHELFEGKVPARVATLPPEASTGAPKMSIADYRKYLDDKGIAYDPAAGKPALRELYEADQA